MSQVKDTPDTGVTRRSLLKGGAAVAGLAAGSGAITGFPTIWAQNIKNVTITHVGQSFSVIPQIGAQASKDLGFKIEMQAVDQASTQALKFRLVGGLSRLPVRSCSASFRDVATMT